jgi:hypothetical protein
MALALLPFENTAKFVNVNFTLVEMVLIYLGFFPGGLQTLGHKCCWAVWS